ncbi:hypothetical protein FRB93_010950 [Tulasnella sp. JGI-2019a]|nr:hypothetical protein FRB93_010950 [Tulasnella sp. JGI-2019a]
MSTSLNDTLPPYHRPLSNPDLLFDQELPLPHGWVKQFDRNSSHYYYVDLRTTPPRSIWVHPFEDEQWQWENARRSGPLGVEIDGKGRPLPEQTTRSTIEHHGFEYPNQAVVTSSASGSSDIGQSSAKSRQGLIGKVVSGVLWVVEKRSASKDREGEFRVTRRLRKRSGSGNDSFSRSGGIFGGRDRGHSPGGLGLIGALIGGLILGSIIGGDGDNDED